MKKSKFTKQQIAFALRQAEPGTPVDEVYRTAVCRKSRRKVRIWKIAAA